MSARAWWLFTLLGIVWGLPYLLIKLAVTELPVSVVVFCRVGIGALVLLPFALRDFPSAVLMRHWQPLLAFSVLEFAVPWGLLSHAELRIGSSTAALLMATIPVLGVLIARWSGGTEVIGTRRAVGLVLGFLGVCVLATPTWQGDLGAMLEVLVAAASYALAAVVASRHLGRVPALPMTFVCLLIASCLYLPPAALAWPGALPSIRALVALGLLGVLCTALAFVWFFGLIREAGMSRTLVITYVNPVVALAAGVLMLAEPFTALQVMALVLILSGSYLATQAGDRTGIRSP